MSVAHHKFECKKKWKKTFKREPYLVPRLDTNFGGEIEGFDFEADKDVGVVAFLQRFHTNQHRCETELEKFHRVCFIKGQRSRFKISVRRALVGDNGPSAVVNGAAIW